MAVDTREKRQSVPGAGRPFMRSHDTAAIDEQWRLGAGNVYNGNALTPAAAGEGIISSLMLMGVGMSIYGISLIIGILYG